MKKFSTSHTYSILFILTERLIDDKQHTINQIVMTSDAPLSIIIVGVGNANFSNMNKLNTNEHPLKASNGKSMKRNVVIFVTLSKIQNCSSQQFENELLEDILFSNSSILFYTWIHPKNGNEFDFLFCINLYFQISPAFEIFIIKKKYIILTNGNKKMLYLLNQNFKNLYRICKSHLI